MNVLPPTITEAQFTDVVIELALRLHWCVSHSRPARNARGWSTPIQGIKGVPDLTLARNGVLILAELKTRNGKRTSDQLKWALHIPEHNYRLWMPDDWPTIVNELKGNNGASRSRNSN